MSIDLKGDNGQYYSKDYFSEIKKNILSTCL